MNIRHHPDLDLIATCLEVRYGLHCAFDSDEHHPGVTIARSNTHDAFASLMKDGPDGYVLAINEFRFEWRATSNAESVAQILVLSDCYARYGMVYAKHVSPWQTRVRIPRDEAELDSLLAAPCHGHTGRYAPSHISMGAALSRVGSGFAEEVRTFMRVSEDSDPMPREILPTIRESNVEPGHWYRTARNTRG